MLPKIGVAVIVRRGPAILMGRRKGAHGAGKLSFPGGHLEPGESVEQCAARELAEETGILSNSGQYRKVAFADDYFPVERLHYITLFLECTSEDVVWQKPQLLEPDKCEGWSWHYTQPPEHELFLPVANLLRDWPGLLWPGPPTVDVYFDPSTKTARSFCAGGEFETTASPELWRWLEDLELEDREGARPRLNISRKSEEACDGD